MHMISIRRAFAGIGAGIALLFTPTTAADATPLHSACNGFRDQPAYDRHCLTRGDQADAAVLWYTTYPASDRRAQCHQALKNGGMVAVVTETRGDLIFDAYRNDRQMTRWVARMGVAECVSLGFKR